MKILFINTSPISGGVERYLLNLCQFLKMKNEIALILSERNPLASEFEKIAPVQFLETGASLEKWRGLNLFSPINFILKNQFKKITGNKVDFDLIVFAGYLKDIFLFSAIGNFVKVCFIHTSPPLWLSLFPFKNLFIASLNKLNKIITVSDFMNLRLRSYIGREKLEVVKNGTDLGKFYPASAEQKEKIKQELNLSINSLVIGNTSRIHRAKGQIDLLKMVFDLKKDYPNLKLLLVDSGSFYAENELKKTIKDFRLEKDVLWLPFQKEIQRFYKAMDIFALPSLSENFPLTILEAMASGLPIVAFKIAGISEQIENKKEGFLISEGNYQDFENKLEVLIKDKKLREEFGQKGREKAEKEFNQNMVFSKVEQIFKATKGDS